MCSKLNDRIPVKDNTFKWKLDHKKKQSNTNRGKPSRQGKIILNNVIDKSKHRINEQNKQL